MWLQNPINHFWYSLRNEKDIFSTLIQGTASYVFDLWVSFVLTERDQLTAQFHDEIVLEVKKDEKDKVQNIIETAIKDTNNYLRLNRELGIGIQWGTDYSQIH